MLSYVFGVVLGQINPKSRKEIRARIETMDLYILLAGTCALRKAE